MSKITVGGVTFKSPEALQSINGYIDTYKRGELPLGLAEIYILRPISLLQKGVGDAL